MRTVALFAFSGVIGFVVDAGVLLLAAPFAGPYAGRALSFVAAVFATWLMNRNLAFRATRSHLPLWREFLRYLGVCLGGGAVNLAAYTALVYLLELTTAWLPLAVAAGSLAGMTVNFTLSRRLVFRGRAGGSRHPR